MTHPNKRILIVDDDIDFLEQTAAALKTAGYEVVTAGGQKEAEDLLQTIRPDCAVLDLMMEHVDGGFALSYHIKKRYPHIPVILVSAVSSETGLEFDAATEEERSWIKADAFLSKPIRTEQLLKEIRNRIKD